MMSEFQAELFRKLLISWFLKHQRDLPWRRTNDPYRIWISEIMLQQTRVAVAIPYYERFLQKYPTYEALAEAIESELLGVWSGLGYYHRARNLQRASSLVKGFASFPHTFDEIRKLPGIGDYTAAAIASISFNLPNAAVDGNVCRVLSRIFADTHNVSSSAGKKHFHTLAHQLLDPNSPGTFNQAMMELGATICLPRNPQCSLCPVSGHCKARELGSAGNLPVKAVHKKNVRTERTVFWIEAGGKILVWERSRLSQFMPGFWELPEHEQLPLVKAKQILGRFRHGITIHNYIFDVALASAPHDLGSCTWVRLSDLDTLPVSTVLRKARVLVNRTYKRDGTPRVAIASS